MKSAVIGLVFLVATVGCGATGITIPDEDFIPTRRVLLQDRTFAVEAGLARVVGRLSFTPTLAARNWGFDGSFSADVPISFLILSNSNFQAFSADQPFIALYDSGAQVAMTFEIPLDTPDGYHFIVDNRQSTSVANTTVTIVFTQEELISPAQ